MEGTAKNRGIPYRLDFLIAVISLLFPFGWSVSGFAPNIVLACACWAITLVASLHYFWAWSRNLGRCKRSRWIVIFGLPSLIIAVAWTPVIREYQRQHPKIQMLQITIHTIPGLPDGVKNTSHLRYQNIEIRNFNEVVIENICGRLQLPEPIYDTVETNLPPGLTLDWKPILTRYTIAGDGDRSFLGPGSQRFYIRPPLYFIPEGYVAQLSGMSEGGDMTGVWQMAIDKLPAHSVISLYFLTSNDGDATNYLALIRTEFKTNGATITTTMSGTTNGGTRLHSASIAFVLQPKKTPPADWHFGTNELRYSFEGTYQYPTLEKPERQHFLVPLLADTNNRTIASLPVQSDAGSWRRVLVEYQ